MLLLYSVKNTYQKISYYFLMSILNLVGTNGFEPSTSRLSGVRSNHLSYAPSSNVSSLLPYGDEEDRTPDPLLAKQVLSQLSYTPIRIKYPQN